jgi:hypothetical protein
MPILKEIGKLNFSEILMNKLKFLSISVAVATLIFTGCGSSDDSTPTVPDVTTQTGTFVDAPVQGLRYKTATQNGLTDAKGNFKYVDGETVEFKLGNLSLGKTTASNFITPYTISDNNDTATNIALLLQNFDGNRSDSNVLDLSKLADYNFTASDFNLSANPTTIKGKIDILFADNNFAQYRDDINNSVLSESDVKNRMDDYINNNAIKFNKKFTVDYLNGKTLYQEYVGFNEPISPYTFNLNNITSFLDENVNPAVTRTGAYRALDGMIRIVDGKIYEYTTDDQSRYNDGINIYTITSIDSDKIVCNVEIPGQKVTVNFYFKNPN